MGIGAGIAHRSVSCCSHWFGSSRGVGGVTLHGVDGGESGMKADAIHRDVFGVRGNCEGLVTSGGKDGLVVVDVLVVFVVIEVVVVGVVVVGLGVVEWVLLSVVGLLVIVVAVVASAGFIRFCLS